VDHRLGNHLGFPETAENVDHIGHLFGGHQRVRGDGGHARIDQRRRVRHGANDFTVMAQRARQLIEGDACGDGDHQRLFIQAGGDIAQDFHHHVRLHCPEDDIGYLRHFLSALRGVDPVLVVQGGDFVRRGGIDPNLAWQDLTAGNQTAENGFAHITAADKTDFLLHHVSLLNFVMIVEL